MATQIKRDRLKRAYDKACMAYIREFERKHEIEFECWIADHVGSICEFGDYYLSFLDVKHDIDYDVPKELIFEWYDKVIEYACNGSKKYINFESYTKGLRFEDL